MPEEKLQTLSLQVINGSELESGRAARCLFTQQGNVGYETTITQSAWRRLFWPVL